MKTILPVISLALLAASAPALATGGGKIRTLDRGTYVCEMPGDAATSRGVPVPEEGFSITNASTYSTPEGRGTYLRTGDSVTMTSGPKKGDRYSVKNERFLRKLANDGTPNGLRCIRLGSGYLPPV